ncbi:ABC transporter substrate-binding protein [Geomicrobium sediminis]|uniref:Peptide/nickel transport system substrate-binding protein n=1 Tax=Geomicrobium sediminis TaxID=1347788 RepID=A0ABS2PBZ5_9BACL|nr:ABC transporter substrate-binding protein [Geomicrobium sediminis]MBM7632822.1 peptide/nickel transport system substrate-binding protein [Geomicrobium sediminis]
MKLRNKYLALSIVPFMLAACGGDDSSETTTDASVDNNDATEISGELQIGYSAQPDTMDPHMSPTTATRDVSRNVFETLVAVNADYEVSPMLAESFEESEDGKTITFQLREGVLFHNGEEMTAEDVKASMEKWTEYSSIGRSNLADAEFIIEDDYTFVIELPERNSVILHVLAEIGQFAAIMPKEVVDEAGPTGANDIIGTGPFEFVEWATDQHIHLTRFDDYVASDEPSSGLVGEKNPQYEDLYFNFVSDASTRVSGLQTGEYDVIMAVPYDNIDLMDSNPSIETMITPSAVEVAVFNELEGVFEDPLMREAVNVGINNEAIMTGSVTSDQFYKLDPGLMLEEQVDWYTDAGKENYFQNDVDRAKELLDEAGYDNELVTIMATRDYDHHYNAAIVLQQELEKLGMNVELSIIDWAAMQEEIYDPSAHDMFVSSFATRSIPHQFPVLSKRAEFAGWTQSEELDRLLDEIKLQETQEDARAVFAELQEQFYEDLPMINIGKFHTITSMDENVEGFDELVGPIFWNVSVND